MYELENDSGQVTLTGLQVIAVHASSYQGAWLQSVFVQMSFDIYWKWGEF